MKANIPVTVKNRAQRTAIIAAMADPEVLAFCIVVGTLKPFSKLAQARMLTFVTDTFAERKSGAR